MKKKQLASMILAFAVAVSTVFAPVNVAADDSVESRSVTLAGFRKGSEWKTDRKTGKICFER